MKQDVYQVEQIAPQTWRIDECGRDNCYLLCGSERALLIDCTIGTGDLMAVVRSLTDLPLTVAVTHAHGDHAGGGYQFGTIHVPRAETDRSWRGPNMRVFRKQLLSNKMKNSGITKKNVRGNNLKTNWLPFDDGAVFDLGGRTIRAAAMPGHTPGGTVFLDDGAHFAFLGDAVCPVLPMHTYRALPLQSFADQSDRLTALLDGYTLFCGHGDGRVTHELVQKQIAWVHEILAKYPENAAKHGKQFYPVFDKAGCVGYDPANLYPTNHRKGWTLASWNLILRG